MYIKYLIEFQACSAGSIAIKYDMTKRIIIIGGHGKNIEVMRRIITDYFLRPKVPPGVWIQQNKVRFTFELKKGLLFSNVINELDKNNFPITEVPKLGRVMR